MTRTRLAAVTVAICGVVLAASSAESSDTFAVRLVSQTDTTITLGWTAQPGYGYLFSSGGVLRSRTNDPSRTSVKFSKVEPASYDVDVITKGSNGHYPVEEPPPPPPPVAKVTQTIANGTTIPDIRGWRAVYDGNGDGVEDDPGKVEFYIDGALVLTELNPPFGDTFLEGTPSTSPGPHTFLVRALDDTGALVASDTVTATVTDIAPPPPPPPAGFPGASNTGVPAGTSLTAYGGPSTITAAGTVIDGKTLGCVAVQTTGVVIKNSRLTCSGGWVLSSWPSSGNYSVTIQDSEINCQSSSGTGIVGAHMTVRRVDIHNCENGMAIDGDTTVEDSFMHDMYNGNQAHADGIQFPDGANNITIRHNTIITLGPGGSSGNLAGSINADTASHSNWLIENNLLGGGAFTVYCVAPGKGSNWVIRNNAFMSNYAVGRSTQCGDETQSGNYVYETGQQITLG